MSISRHPRMLLATVAAVTCLGSWAPIDAGGPQTPGVKTVGGLADACEQALRTRLPSRGTLAIAAAPEVEALGGGDFRLVSSFEAGQGPTSFACEVTQRAGLYEVVALTLVQW